MLERLMRIDEARDLPRRQVATTAHSRAEVPRFSRTVERKFRAAARCLSAGMLLTCVGLLAAALPAEAQTTYISNTGQTYDPDFSYLVGPDHLSGQYSYAQQFTTGKEPDGYALGSVELYLRHVGRMDVPKVSIYTSKER